MLRQDYEDIEGVLLQLAGRALTYGVHLVIAANRWLELRLGMRDLMGTKLELKLGDAIDSEIDRRTAAAVPSDRPGRGITQDRFHYLAAVPRIDGVSSDADLGTGVADLVRRVDDAWHGPVAPKVQLLPRDAGVRRVAGEPARGHLYRHRGAEPRAGRAATLARTLA